MVKWDWEELTEIQYRVTYSLPPHHGLVMFVLAHGFSAAADAAMGYLQHTYPDAEMYIDSIQLRRGWAADFVKAVPRKESTP